MTEPKNPSLKAMKELLLEDDDDDDYDIGSAQGSRSKSQDVGIPSAPEGMDVDLPGAPSIPPNAKVPPQTPGMGANKNYDEKAFGYVLYNGNLMTTIFPHLFDRRG